MRLGGCKLGGVEGGHSTTAAFWKVSKCNTSSEWKQLEFSPHQAFKVLSFISFHSGFSRSHSMSVWLGAPPLLQCGAGRFFLSESQMIKVWENVKLSGRIVFLVDSVPDVTGCHIVKDCSLFCVAGVYVPPGAGTGPGTGYYPGIRCDFRDYSFH